MKQSLKDNREMYLAAIRACCDSLFYYVEDITNEDLINLEDIYSRILTVQERVVWGKISDGDKTNT